MSIDKQNRQKKDIRTENIRHRESVLYIAAAVLMAICIYMIVVNSMYVVNYASSYG